MQTAIPGPPRPQEPGAESVGQGQSCWGRADGATAVFVVLFLAVLAYMGQLRGPFLFDDDVNIVAVKALRMTALSWDAVSKVFTEAFMLTRPLSNLSFAVNYSFGGLETFGYKVVNLVIHLAVTVCVYAVVRRVIEQAGGPRATRVAWCAAGLWALNPVQTQAVSYIVQRMTSLCALFFLLAFLAYLKASEPESRGWLWWPMVLLSWVLACLSKEIALTFPLVVVAYELTVTGRLTWGKLREHWPAVAGIGVVLVALLGAGDLAVLERTGKHLSAHISEAYRVRDFGPVERLLSQPRAAFFYLSLFFWPLPSRLSLNHAFEASRSLIDPWTTLPAALGVLGVVAGAIRWRRRFPVASFCVLWFVATSLVEASILPIELVFEHRVYLPSVGLAVLAAVALNRLVPSARWTCVIAGSLCVALSAATYQRNKVWTDAVVFWQDAVEKAPEHWRPHYGLGANLHFRGKVKEAEREYRRAIELRPTSSSPYTNLAFIVYDLGRWQEAEALHTRALEMKPDSENSHYGLALVYDATGRRDLANDHWRRYLDLADPESPHYRNARNRLQRGASGGESTGK